MRYWIGAAMSLLLAGSAVAAEKADFTRDAASGYVPTAPAMDCGGNDAEALVSLRKNGRVIIGGFAQVRYAWSRVSADDGTFSPAFTPAGGPPRSRESTFHSSNWESYAAALFFRVEATENSFLTVKLDVDDAWNGMGDQDDLLEEVYFTMQNLQGTGFGFKAGKQEVPFGMDKDILLIGPYLHSADSFLAGPRNGSNSWGGFYGFVNDGNPFTWMPRHSVEYDNMFGIVPFWKGDCLQIEASVFQDRNNGGRGNSGRHWTNDPGLSFSTRVTYTPVETLKIMASGITFHNNAMGKADGSAERWYASSLAFDWNPTFYDRKLNFFGEWQHSKDVDFRKNYDSDDIHVGGSIALTEKLSLFAQYEWLKGRNNGISPAARQTLHRAIGALQYTMASGIYWEAGYQREWGKIVTANAGQLNPAFGGTNRAAADVIYCGLGYFF